MRLTEILVERREHFPKYEFLIPKILNFIQIPPILTKSSDVLIYSREIEEYFTFIGKIFNIQMHNYV